MQKRRIWLVGQHLLFVLDVEHKLQITGGKTIEAMLNLSKKLCLAVLLVSCAIAQTAPASWNHPWHSSEEQEIARYAMTEEMRGVELNPVKVYSAAELIDLAESVARSTF
jgi:hypothetical protein